MNYTICINEDLISKMTVSVDKDGNKYVVSLWDSEEHRGTHRKFNSLEEAFALFTEMSKCFVFGLYSKKDRFEKFNNN